MEKQTLFQELIKNLKKQQRLDEELEEIEKAYELANQYHSGQVRASGEEYIIHPLGVALILSELQPDKETIIAALLHDVLEDTDITAAELKEKFGETILEIVEGVTKLSKFSFSSKEQRQAENFRKMFLAMADDIRIILLKLADRLHNMRTLQHMPPEKQKRIAKETLEIFSPLSNRLGMWQMKAELDDLSLFYLEPQAYNDISQKLAESEQEREKIVKIYRKKIASLLKEVEINGEVYGRAKHIYSIYKKMKEQDKTFVELYDIMAVRAIVDTEKECYEALGIIHSAFKPIPGRFKDFIAMPKSNMYRSLHTTIMGPTGKPLEVQIRTQEMHDISEYGIAAHWKYKEKLKNPGKNDLDQKFVWLRKLVEIQKDIKDAREYVDSVKIDLFRDEVFVFTPRGDVHDLPNGALPIDFAYRIHTDIGHTCVGCLINGKMVPLDTTLKNGDIIEIITNRNSHPKLHWLNIVTTNSAKSRIKAWFKKHNRKEHINQGKQLLEADLTKAKLDEIVKSGKLLEIAKQLNYNALEDLFAGIGYGEVNTLKVSNRLKKEETQTKELLHKPRFASNRSPANNTIKGLDGMLYHISKCCFPLPGENIVGVVTRSRGISIHREDCKTLSKVEPERLMNISWSEKSQLDKTSTYPVSFIIEVIDRIGVFKDILGKIADNNTNLTYAGVKTNTNKTAIVEISAEVASKQHFDKLINSLYEISDIINIRRAQPGTTVRSYLHKKLTKKRGQKN